VKVKYRSEGGISPYEELAHVKKRKERIKDGPEMVDIRDQTNQQEVS
jgi:hypothetical protein